MFGVQCSYTIDGVVRTELVFQHFVVCNWKSTLPSSFPLSVCARLWSLRNLLTMKAATCVSLRRRSQSMLRSAFVRAGIGIAQNPCLFYTRLTKMLFVLARHTRSHARTHTHAHAGHSCRKPTVAAGWPRPAGRRPPVCRPCTHQDTSRETACVAAETMRRER